MRCGGDFFGARGGDFSFIFIFPGVPGVNSQPLVMAVFFAQRTRNYFRMESLCHGMLQQRRGNVAATHRAQQKSMYRKQILPLYSKRDD